MLALPLLLALAVTAEAPAAPAAPEVASPAAPEVAAAAAPEAPAAAAAAAPAAAEEAEPGVIVAPADAPAAAPAAPAAPFVVEGFLDPKRLATGANVRAGLSTSGATTALDATLRCYGVILGATVGIAAEVDPAIGSTGLRTMGFLAGYGMQRGLYRGEAILGWGVTDERVKTSEGTFSQSGHFTSVQAALDRVTWGGPGWRAALGLTAWWRSVDPNASATLATVKDEFGVAARIGADVGW